MIENENVEQIIPAISIIIPCYEFKGKGVVFLRKLLKSIESQTFKDFEIIISDHSINKDIKNEIDWNWQSLNIKYFYNDRGRGNSSINMNFGLSKASGNIKKIMHADDYFCSDEALHKIADAVKQNPEQNWGIIGFNHFYVDLIEIGNIITGVPGCPSSSFFVGEIYFDENLFLNNDHEIHQRLYDKNLPIIIPEILVTIRMHDAQVSAFLDKKRNEEELLYMENKENMLSDIANKYGTDKGTEIILPGHHGPRLGFTKIYHKYFRLLKYNKLNFLEIGIGSGTSLKMWDEYFYDANIFAIDIDDHKNMKTEKIKIFMLDQSNRDQLLNFMSNCPEFDIIIDDGGHMMQQQQISIGILFDKLKSGGLYFIEDLHTSFWESDRELYGNKIDINEDRSNTTVAMIENYIKNKKIKSSFLSDLECENLENKIADCILFDLGITEYGPNKLALFIKK